MTSKIDIKELSKDFLLRDGTSVRAIESVNLSVSDGEFLCILGPSGCGKSTLLRILGGLEEASSGTISIDSAGGNSYGSRRPLQSMIFQQDSSFPWMKVKANVAYGLRARSVPKELREQVAEDYIGKVGLRRFENAYPHELSGGMRQRVAVARAFANDPEIFLMDEPFASLDEQTRLVLQSELLHLWEAAQKTVIFVTHSIDEAIILSDRLVVMSASPGRILQELEIPFERPRVIEAIKGEAAYAELFAKIWELLRDSLE